MALPGPPSAPTDDPEGTRGGEEAEESPSRPHSSDLKSQPPELTFCSFDPWNSSTSLYCLTGLSRCPPWATPKLQYIPLWLFVTECGKPHNLFHYHWVEHCLSAAISAAEAAGNVWSRQESIPSAAQVLLNLVVSLTLAGSKYWHVISQHAIFVILCHDVVCDALALDCSVVRKVECHSQVSPVGLMLQIDFYILLEYSMGDLELVFLLVTS